PGTSTHFDIFLDCVGPQVFTDPPRIRIETSDDLVDKYWIEGRPVRVRGTHLYWPVVGLDEIEIQRSSMEALRPATASAR
ncbi:MAG TPA: hypothetical protein VFR10_12990, partial [bacterium]|nr:hypothetical protein [bacterium]